MDVFRRLAELQRTFVAPAPLDQARPRAVRLTAAGHVLLALAFALFAGAIGTGVGMHGVVRRQADTRRTLVNDGVIVDGVVSRLWQDGDNRRRVEYRFVVDGRSYSGRINVSSERRRRLDIGSPVAVRYVPANPGMNDLGGAPPSGMPVLLPFIVSPAIAILGVLCLFLIERQRRLLADGRAAPGLVTAHHTHNSSHGGTHRSISYQFPLLSGAVASGRSASSRQLPAIGSVVCVLYDPEWPKRNGVYPLSLVRPAGGII